MNRRHFMKATAGAVSSAVAVGPPESRAQSASGPIDLSFEFSGLCAAQLWQKSSGVMNMLLIDGHQAKLDPHTPLLIAKAADVVASSQLEEPTVWSLGGTDFLVWSLWDRFVTVDGFDDLMKGSLVFATDPCESAKVRPDKDQNGNDQPKYWMDRHWTVHLHTICDQRNAQVQRFNLVASTVRLTKGKAYCGMPGIQAQRDRIYQFGKVEEVPFKQAFTDRICAKLSGLDVPQVTLKFWYLDRREGKPESEQGTILLKPKTGTEVPISVANVSSSHHATKGHFKAFYSLIRADRKPEMCTYKNQGTGSPTGCDDHVPPDAPSPFCIPPVIMEE